MPQQHVTTRLVVRETRVLVRANSIALLAVAAGLAQVASVGTAEDIEAVTMIRGDDDELTRQPNQQRRRRTVFSSSPMSARCLSVALTV